MSKIDGNSLEMSSTRKGTPVFVVPAGTLAEGDIVTRDDTMTMCMAAPEDGWEPTGAVNGFGEAEYTRTRHFAYRVTGLGKPFQRKARYIDEEDSRSFRADGKATVIRADTRDMQYAYIEAAS